MGGPTGGQSPPPVGADSGLSAPYPHRGNQQRHLDLPPTAAQRRRIHALRAPDLSENLLLKKGKKEKERKKGKKEKRKRKRKKGKKEKRKRKKGKGKGKKEKRKKGKGKGKKEK